MKKIHHIGIVSENLDLVLNMLNIEKSKIKEVVDDNIQHNLLHLIRLENNDLWIEIIVPKNNNSTVHSILHIIFHYNIGIFYSFRMFQIVTIRRAMYDLFLDKFSYGSASFIPISVKKLEEMYGFMTGVFNKLYGPKFK